MKKPAVIIQVPGPAMQLGSARASPVLGEDAKLSTRQPRTGLDAVPRYSC
jgi:hypothetical protein